MSNKKILAAVHLYPPKHLCGGEMYLHRLLKKLQGEGCECRVLLLNAQFYGITRVYVYDGIEVYPNDRDVILANLEWTDVFITHLDYTQQVIGYGLVYKKPVVHLVHNNTRRPDILQERIGQAIIYNSYAVEASILYPFPSIVLHPPCDYRAWDDGEDHSQAEFITLVNLDGNKGGKILTQIALAMPDKRFLGVVGSYSSPPEEGQHTRQPPNVEVIGKTSRMRSEVYGRTRILIAPSKYESWGMVMTEAMASGIPVIASALPGPMENCGEAGTYIENREDIDAWIRAIRSMENHTTYQEKSLAARARSRELDPLKELQVAADWIKQVTYSLLLQSEKGAVSTAALPLNRDKDGKFTTRKETGAKPPGQKGAKPPAKKATA